MKIYPKAQWHIGTDVVFFKLSKQEILPLNSEKNSILDEMRTNFENLEKRSYNQKLAGQIQHEYEMSNQAALHIEKVLHPAVQEYINNYANSMFLNPDNIVLSISECWINFQKKYEYNPVHRHYGFLSFVIWLQIPYESQNEMNEKNSIHSNSACNGDFCFITSNHKNITQVSLKIDKSWNARGAIFSSQLSHVVYPFYTSDEYRISIAGNYRIG